MATPEASATGVETVALAVPRLPTEVDGDRKSNWRETISELLCDKRLNNKELARMFKTNFEQKFAGDEPDVTILRVEAHKKDQVAAFTLVDRYDKKTKLTSMMVV